MAERQDREAYPSVSVVVPAYREAANLPALLSRVDAVRRASHLDLELIVIDDNSEDGTELVMAESGFPWARLLIRLGPRGLSEAVLAGFEAAAKDVLLVMDADLSHPPEKIPDLLRALRGGADYALGSRYAPGGSTDPAWGMWRLANSRASNWLARPFMEAADPGSGFFAIFRRTFEEAAPLRPLGYRIGLEIFVKGGCQRPVEIPIHFDRRNAGESKFGMRVRLHYLQHLLRLAAFRRASRRR